MFFFVVVVFTNRFSHAWFGLDFSKGKQQQAVRTEKQKKKEKKTFLTTKKRRALIVRKGPLKGSEFPGPDLLFPLSCRLELKKRTLRDRHLQG